MTEISPLRRRMIEDMTVRNLSPATQRSYVHAVAKFARFFGRSSETLNLEDVRAYQVHLVAGGMSWPALNQTVCALRFLYGVTLRQADLPERIVYARAPQRLPVVLSTEEVVRFPEAVPSLKSSRCADHGICGGSAGIGSGQPQGCRFRQQPYGHSRRARQRPPRSLRDAVIAPARYPARLLAPDADGALVVPSPGRRASDPSRHAECRLSFRLCRG